MKRTITRFYPPRPAGRRTSPPVFAKLQQAIARHRQGRLVEAEALYRAVLQASPRHFDALHGLGLLALQTGRAAEAATLVGQALAANPHHAEALLNFGVAMKETRRLPEALDSFDRALRLKPDCAEAHYNRAAVLQALDRPQEALAGYERALAIKPDYAEARLNCGIALHALGRLEEALASFDHVLAVKPGYAVAHYNRAIVLQALGRLEDALAGYAQAVRLKPDYAAAFNAQGQVLQTLKRPEEALASYGQAVRIDPGYAEAFNNQGNALQDLRRWEEALACYDQALRLKPGYAEALHNRGAALQHLDRPQEAVACYDQALRLKPGYAEAHCNRGAALQELGQAQAALASYAQALRLKPGYADAHFNESLARLLTGDFARGWEEYEWRWRAAAFPSPRRDIPQPLWLGQEPLQGKTILLHAEQGLGDTIQFCRYAKRVAEQGATVWLEVPAPLKALLTTLEGVGGIVAAGEPLPAFDYHCPLMSLPLACRTTLANIPAAASYLRADPGLAKRWQARLGGAALPRIGLVWSGGTAFKNDRNRSIPLSQFSKLPTPQAQFASLQKELREADRAELERHPEIAHYGDELFDFAETAALIANLDLVVAVDTAVAHLAAALGKPVWLLLPFCPDWRWLLDRDDSPWYPTVRLFRQDTPGDWDGVIARVADALGNSL